MKNTVVEINKHFNIYRTKSEYYPLYLVPIKNDLFKKVFEVNHAISEEGKDVVVCKETGIKKQCFELPEYIKIKAEDINNGSLITCISGIIQAQYRQEIS